jgi:hypothetical protein
LHESARDDVRRAYVAAQAEQLQQVADDAAVDQFIRHAESGFFGGDGGPAIPSCGTATTKLPPTEEGPGEQEVEDARVAA